MMCSQCKKREATVHFNAMVNGKAIKLEICEECAKFSSIVGSFNFPPAPPAMAELMDLLAGWQRKTGTAAVKKDCPACHWTLAQFQKTGRMGCAECYAHFHTEVRNFIKRIQGQVVHKGKKAGGGTTRAKPVEKKESAEGLKAQLDKAVREEKYEQAAVLRDKIRALEGQNER